MDLSIRAFGSRWLGNKQPVHPGACAAPASIHSPHSRSAPAQRSQIVALLHLPKSFAGSARAPHPQSPSGGLETAAPWRKRACEGGNYFRQMLYLPGCRGHSRVPERVGCGCPSGDTLQGSGNTMQGCGNAMQGCWNAMQGRWKFVKMPREFVELPREFVQLPWKAFSRA